MRRSDKVIQEAMKGTAAMLRAAQGPPPPPPTWDQRLVAWFDRNLSRPLGWTCIAIGLSAAAHIGWDLIG